jgi:hypothetical protein
MPGLQRRGTSAADEEKVNVGASQGTTIERLAFADEWQADDETLYEPHPAIDPSLGGRSAH